VTASLALVSALMFAEAGADVAERDFLACLPGFFPQAEFFALAVDDLPDAAVVAPCSAACVLAGFASWPDALVPVPAIPVPAIPVPSADALSLTCAPAGLAAPDPAAGELVPGSGLVDGVDDVDGLVLSLGVTDELGDVDGVPADGWPGLNRLTAGGHDGLGDALPPMYGEDEPLPSGEAPPLPEFAPGCEAPLVGVFAAPESVAKIDPGPARPR
jgi:hypothetical protein